jgi:hypothetical protein
MLRPKPLALRVTNQTLVIRIIFTALLLISGIEKASNQRPLVRSALISQNATPIQTARSGIRDYSARMTSDPEVGVFGVKLTRNALIG